jgi:hypothetical protein
LRLCGELFYLKKTLTGLKIFVKIGLILKPNRICEENFSAIRGGIGANFPPLKEIGEERLKL